MELRIISAGAGSGKTYRLTTEMTALLTGQGLRPSGIIATTFTNKAAAELQERVRVRLLSEGRSKEADELANAMIGTVHSLGVRLLQRFAFEAGVSPEVDIIAQEDQQQLFNRALANVLTEERVVQMEALSERLGLTKQDRSDWRSLLKELTEIARANDFSAEVLRESKQRSFDTFQALIGPPKPLSEGYEQVLNRLLKGTIARLASNEDSTKKTAAAAATLRQLQRQLDMRGQLAWHEWAKLSKTSVGAKSRDDAQELVDFAAEHHKHPLFHEDIQAFTDQLFELALAGIGEFSRYKKRRGLIDYTDMEVLVNRLLDQDSVQAVLREEIDLLMVDEFQDTSPIQLEIFLKLSRLAKHSVWVGDPKQSIYGFRGADPELMQAIIQQQGGIRPEDIQGFSWRSRELIVHTTNALFTKAFPELPKEQVALKAKRCRDGSGRPDCQNKGPEPAELGYPLIHWHFQHDGGKRPPGRPWMEDCLADTLLRWLNRQPYIAPKDGSPPRHARPGDVAILCRSNSTCQVVAEALHRAGLQAAISRAGLLQTAEARYILACLKYLLNQYDSLAVAEILMLSGTHCIEEIIENRLAHLQASAEQTGQRQQWGSEAEIIKALAKLRPDVLELSSAETLDLMLESLQLRHHICRWGNERQRLSNVDALRRYALQYEEACNRLHTAASTGGFLLWLDELEKAGGDEQGSGEGPQAINVLTYHRSKGLEWPVVICHDLENKLRADPWGFDILSDSEEVDLEQVLSNRWLRYWVNPYSDQYRNTYWHEQLLGSEANARARRLALAEEARLLYVGVTRARDYLVFPTRQLPAKWLNRVWQAGEEDHPTLDPNSEETPWDWEGAFINIQTEALAFGRDFTHEQSALPDSLLYLSQRAGKQPHPHFDIELPQDSFRDEVVVELGMAMDYAAPILLKEGVDRQAAASALQAFLRADQPSYAQAVRLEMAAGFLERYDLDAVPAALLLQTGDNWQRLLEEQFPAQQEWRHYPLRYFHGGRLFETGLHLLRDTPAGLTLVQHCAYEAANTAKLKKWAQGRMGDWAYLSGQGACAVFGRQAVRCFLHFPLNGCLLELKCRRLVVPA